MLQSISCSQDMIASLREILHQNIILSSHHYYKTSSGMCDLQESLHSLFQWYTLSHACKQNTVNSKKHAEHQYHEQKLQKHQCL